MILKSWEDFTQLQVLLDRFDEYLLRTHSVEMTEIQCLYFDKNFVKATFLLKRWFHEIFLDSSLKTKCTMQFHEIRSEKIQISPRIPMISRVFLDFFRSTRSQRWIRLQIKRSGYSWGRWRVFWMFNRRISICRQNFVEKRCKFSKQKLNI